jgi:MFS family permease
MTMDAFAVNVTTKYTSLYIVDYLQLDPFILALLPIISTSVTVLTMLFVATPYFANQGKKLQRIILLTSLIAPVSSIIFLLAYDFTSLAISQILGVIGSSIYNPASNALWMNMIPRNRRGRIFALTALMRSIIILPAPVIGGYFFEWINPRAPFFILTAFECFAVLIIASAKEPDFQEI